MNARRLIGSLLAVVSSACAWLAWQDWQGNTSDVSHMSDAISPAQPAASASVRDGVRPDATRGVTIDDASRMPPPSDLFAAHRWIAVPGARSVAPSRPRPAAAAPPPAFEVAAVWRFDERHPVVVLERHGQTWVACETCDAPGHIAPGDTFALGYRLERIDARTLTYARKAIARRTTLALPMPEPRPIRSP